MLNGKGTIFNVPCGYTLAKLRRDKKQAHTIYRCLASAHSSSDKMREYKQLIYSHFGI